MRQTDALFKLLHIPKYYVQIWKHRVALTHISKLPIVTHKLLNVYTDCTVFLSFRRVIHLVFFVYPKSLFWRVGMKRNRLNLFCFLLTVCVCCCCFLNEGMQRVCRGLACYPIVVEINNLPKGCCSNLFLKYWIQLAGSKHGWPTWLAGCQKAYIAIKCKTELLHLFAPAAGRLFPPMCKA